MLGRWGSRGTGVGGVWTCCLRSSRGRGFQSSLGAWDKRGGTCRDTRGAGGSALETWVRESQGARHSSMG